MIKPHDFITVCSAEEVSKKHISSDFDDDEDDDEFLKALSSHCLADPQSSLALSSSFSSFASFTSESCTFSYNHLEDGHENSCSKRICCDSSETTIHFDDSFSTLPTKKRVRFGGITVREHSVTVGSHNITCPVELSWEFRQQHWSSHTSYCAANSKRSKGLLHPLSLDERREWITLVLGVTVADVKLMEQEMLARRSRSERKNLLSSSFDIDIGVKYRNSADRPPRMPSKLRHLLLERTNGNA